MVVDDEININDLSDQGALNVFLDSLPDEQDGALSGFTLSLSWEATDEFAVPSGLELPSLGEAVSVRIDADKFTAGH